MPRIKVVYECSDEILALIEKIESHLDMKSNKEEILQTIQDGLQTAFDEGRKLQKYSCSSLPKDCLLSKTEI